MTHDEVANILFSFLRDIIYAPEKARLEASDLPEEYDKLVQGFNLFAKWQREANAFTLGISNGDLQQEPPSRDNILTASMKSLQSNLLHLTWQTQEVAKGNYNQRVDFMGDFSKAFNIMVDQLKERQENLEHNAKSLEEKNASLTRARDFFRQVVMHIRRCAICFDVNGRIVFQNIAAIDFADKYPQVYAQLCAYLIARSTLPYQEINLATTKGEFWFALEELNMEWNSKEERLYLFEDITEVYNKNAVMARFAQEDELTGLYNRRYAMEFLERSYNDTREFSLAFIDLNSLKSLNDELGHEVGDIYIKSMAQKLKKEIPWDHMSARVGGDEFLLVAFSVRKKQLEEHLENMNKEYSIRLTDGTNHPVSFSYGVVELDKNYTVSQLLRNADELMYHYKFEHKKKLR